MRSCKYSRCESVLICSVCLQPLRVNGVKVYTENVDKRQIIMDLQIRWAGARSISSFNFCEEVFQS